MQQHCSSLSYPRQPGTEERPAPVQCVSPGASLQDSTLHTLGTKGCSPQVTQSTAQWEESCQAGGGGYCSLEGFPACFHLPHGRKSICKLKNAKGEGVLSIPTEWGQVAWLCHLLECGLLSQSPRESTGHSQRTLFVQMGWLEPRAGKGWPGEAH